MDSPTLSTRTGDTGETGLFGGKRLSKTSTRVHAYGDVDELNACIGLILAEEELPESVRSHLQRTQHTLFTLGTDLATPLEHKKSVPRISADHISELERWGTELEQTLAPLQQFILPSGSRIGALVHLARTVCRRAERWIVSLNEEEEVNPHVLIYLNRLSDYLFLAARTTNKHLKKKETTWDHN